MPHGTIKATVLIETILAAFEMDEILYELREHSAGLNAGRWDYIFSVIKKLGHRPEFVLPDRAAVTMAVPFMRAYTELLVKTCHRARRARDRRHGGVHPVAARPRGERGRAREGARGQGARGRPGLRRHLGRASRPRAGRDGDLRPGARRAAEPGRAAARRRLRVGAPTLLDVAATPGEITDGGPAQQRLGRDPVPRRLAAGLGRGRDLQPDGGRGDLGDLALAGLAVAARTARSSGRTSSGRSTRRWRSSTATTPRRASSSSRSRSGTSSSSS